MIKPNVTECLYSTDTYSLSFRVEGIKNKSVTHVYKVYQGKILLIFFVYNFLSLMCVYCGLKNNTFKLYLIDHRHEVKILKYSNVSFF